MRPNQTHNQNSSRGPKRHHTREAHFTKDKLPNRTNRAPSKSRPYSKPQEQTGVAAQNVIYMEHQPQQPEQPRSKK